ncbi:MAG: PleD family two-component system response regulator [Pseudomonadota bacterium]
MPGRILVVDDIPSSRLIVRAKLSMAYYDVIEAESGDRALVLARTEQPDLILLDIMMPGRDGFETCLALKEMPETAHIPVVMLSSLNTQVDRIRGLDCGADDFLTKPVDDAALLARVSSLTRMKMMIDELRMRAETSRELGVEPPPTVPVGDVFADASVLVVSSDAEFAETAAQSLHASLHSAVEIAGGEQEARALIQSNSYDAFVLGERLADGDPMRVASIIRGRPDTRQSALVMVFDSEDQTGPALALDMGVPDYLSSPPDLAEMSARLRVQLRRKYYSDRLRETLEASMVQAMTDSLTSLHNRRYANAHLEQMMQKPRSGQHRLAAMMLDLDRFKQVNDTHGHGAGDDVLVEFAARLKRAVRNVDLVSRVGGEEFLVVLPDILPENAKRAAERMRHSIETPGFDVGVGSGRINVTVSIGLALYEEGESRAEFLERADQALFASKAAGRNMVTLSAA